jgi:glycosyltransferase involved in cell wall biosynthesis
MRVGIDAGPLLDPLTGVGRYTLELAGALERAGVDVVRFAVAWGGRAHGIRRLRLPARLARALWRRGLLTVDRLAGCPDVVHATNFVLPACRAPGVVTVHDLSFEFDEAFPGAAALRTLVPWSLRRAAVVVVPSRSVADEVAARYGVAEERLAVTPEGVGERFFGATPLADAALAGIGLRRPFALALGTLEPRKNLTHLLQAWEAARARLPGWTLALAGRRGWGPALPAAQGVVYTGYVAEETLPGLLAAAEVFCYPSSYEGFGLPPLEAMAAGTAVLAGAYPAAHEVLGDAALLVDPRDPAGMAEGLVALAEDGRLRAELERAGRARAAIYTWEGCARATVAAYERALGG